MARSSFVLNQRTRSSCTLGPKGQKQFRFGNKVLELVPLWDHKARNSFTLGRKARGSSSLAPMGWKYYTFTLGPKSQKQSIPFYDQRSSSSSILGSNGQNKLRLGTKWIEVLPFWDQRIRSSSVFRPYLSKKLTFVSQNKFVFNFKMTMELRQCRSESFSTVCVSA